MLFIPMSETVSQSYITPLGVLGTAAAVRREGPREFLRLQLHIVPCCCRQVFKVLEPARAALPARQLPVLDLDPSQRRYAGRERHVVFARFRVRVRDGHLDGLKVIEDVELGQIDSRVVVNCGRVLDDDEVEMTTKVPLRLGWCPTIAPHAYDDARETHHLRFLPVDTPTSRPMVSIELVSMDSNLSNASIRNSAPYAVFRQLRLCLRLGTAHRRRA